MEIVDQKIEINTYSELIKYFKQVVLLLGKTRIKALYHTSGCDDFIDGELYIVFEDKRALVIANRLTSFGTYELQSKYKIWYRNYYPKHENVFTSSVKGKYIDSIKALHFSEGFSTHPCRDDRTPDGGDYYSRVGMFLNTGDILSFYGYSSNMDGYMGLHYSERQPVVIWLNPDLKSTFYSNYGDSFAYNEDVYIKYKNYGKLEVPGLKELLTEYDVLKRNVLESGTDNPHMDKQTQQYFKTRSREITNILQKKLPKRFRIYPDLEWEDFL